MRATPLSRATHVRTVSATRTHSRKVRFDTRLVSRIISEICSASIFSQPDTAQQCGVGRFCLAQQCIRLHLHCVPQRLMIGVVCGLFRTAQISFQVCLELCFCLRRAYPSMRKVACVVDPSSYLEEHLAFQRLVFVILRSQVYDSYVYNTNVSAGARAVIRAHERQLCDNSSLRYAEYVCISNRCCTPPQKLPSARKAQPHA